MLDGIFSSNLPWVLMSYGISNLLYILFYFFSPGATTNTEEKALSQIKSKKIVTESSENKAEYNHKTFYLKDDIPFTKATSPDNTNVPPILSFKKFKPPLLSSDFQAYFLKGNRFYRPPPVVA